jgi:hypothetical protein
MEAVEITMSLFRAMNDEEKRATILALGEEVEETGLVERLFGKTNQAAGKVNRKGSRKRGSRLPYWVRLATGIDPSQKGVMQIEGQWLSGTDLGDREEGDLIVIGFRWPEKIYHLLRVVRDETAIITGGPDGKLEVTEAAPIASGGFGDVMEQLREHLG